MNLQTMPVFPRGWYVVCFSQELEQGQVRDLKYFNQRLVAFRGEDGQAHVLDGYCAHMGAALGAGGKVVGCTVQCPFHGWRFEGSGKCVDIPGAKKIPPKAKQKAWKVVERNGVVMVYYSPFGNEPEFEIPVIEEYGSEKWLPWSISQYHIKTHPREVVDNLADKSHFRFVHNTEISEFDFKENGLSATQYATGKAFLPGGGVDEFSSQTTYHGPAYLLMRMDGALKNYMLFAHTPVDDNSLDLRLAVTLKIVGSREQTEGYVAQYIDNLRAGFEDDIRIWENKIYRDPPMISEADGPIGHLRRWYKQFYRPYEPPTEASVSP
jgi:3-ketosteroid 9alpha-monooxygenase subunit A